LFSCRHVKSFFRAPSVPPSHHWPWSCCCPCLPPYCPFSHLCCSLLLPKPTTCSQTPHLSSDPYRFPDHCCLHSWLVCCGPGAELIQPSSRHRCCYLHPGTCSVHRWCFDPSNREGQVTMEDPSQANGKRENHVESSVLIRDTNTTVSCTNGSAEQLLYSALHRFLSV
jgi:hypothetical protein